MDDSAAQADRGAAPVRYRCTACGNLTRFEVTQTRRTREFHHYTVGGDLRVEESTVLESSVESVVCRWCGNGDSVVRFEADDVDIAPNG